MNLDKGKCDTDNMVTLSIWSFCSIPDEIWIEQESKK